MKVVVANSIGVDKSGYFIIHSPSRWSSGVKNKYNWFAYYPWELAYLSSLLKKETDCQVKMVDGCLEKLSFDKYYQKISAQKPDFLVMESATRTIEENLALALKIKEKSGARLIFTGQHASAFPEDLLRQGVDYVCVGEYELTVLEIIKGRQKNDILGLYPNPRRPLLDINGLPWPEDNDVSRFAYALPGEPSCEYREIQMYASRGCPATCNFCVARHVYYDCPNWRPRKIEDVVDEITCLRQKYPDLEGIFFDEESHNANKKFILALTQAIIAARMHDLKYEAMCDVRFFDEDVLSAMKRAGYYKIRVGIETASQKVMEQMGKQMDLVHVRETLVRAQKMGIKTYGTFTFGSIGADNKEDAKTLSLIEELIKKNLLDNLQVSICTPQPGTPFYEKAKRDGILRGGLRFCEYDGENFSMLDYPEYNHREIEKNKEKAFLLRDHYLLFAKIRNFSFLAWICRIYNRYGLKGLLQKAGRRLVREAQYLIVK